MGWGVFGLAFLKVILLVIGEVSLASPYALASLSEAILAPLGSPSNSLLEANLVRLSSALASLLEASLVLPDGVLVLPFSKAS